MLNAAILGYGGIARTHRGGYKILEEAGKARLVAVCDIREEAFGQEIKINLKSEDSGSASTFHCYTDLEEMLVKEQIDFIDICIPSYLHREYSVKLLKKGYNVLCEKPMALNSEDCEAMIAAERESGKKFMIAQVLRFFNEYEFLKNCIENETFGKPLAAHFKRISCYPTWGWNNWFMDYDKSGGCITDLHIHDVDIVRYLFGEPKAVSCHAVDTCTKYDLVQTSFHYDNVIVNAHGSWASKKTPFSSGYRVDFEKASVIYESGKVTVYPNDDTPSYSPELGNWNGYTNEIAYFCDVVNETVENKRNPVSSAAKTIRLIEVMKQSADLGGAIITM